jgi:hypothetical protein
MTASFQILSNSSFTYHPFIRHYTVLVTEKAPLTKLQIKWIQRPFRRKTVRKYQRKLTMSANETATNGGSHCRRTAVQAPASVTLPFIYNTHIITLNTILVRNSKKKYVSRVTQSVYCLATGWTTGGSRFDPRHRRKDFSCSLCVQTCSGAHPASCTMGTVGPFPGNKARPGRDADHSPHILLRSTMSRSYTSTPSMRLHGV